MAEEYDVKEDQEEAGAGGDESVVGPRLCCSCPLMHSTSPLVVTRDCGYLAALLEWWQ